jgi:hypothetical protein
MAVVRAAFSELNTSITGSMKFGDGAWRFAVGAPSSFRCLNDEHRALTDVYYIARLHSNIISLG